MTDHDSLVRSEFSRQADAIASAAVFNDRAILERICEAAQALPGTRILDVACGPGIVVEALAGRGGEIVGCDLTAAMLQKTRARALDSGLANVVCVPARAEALPFQDASFDAVVSRSAVHHFACAPVALREMARVTRPGGRVVTVDVMSAEVQDEADLHNALETLRDPSHVRMLARAELHAALRAAGLQIASCVTWTNRREFDEWMAIVRAPERVDPLRCVMHALARAGVCAGIGLRLESGRLAFEHTAALTVAVKP